MTFLRSCVALVAVLASPPSFACGFHDSVQLQKGILNWVYPDSLHVGTAVWMAQEAGRLARDNLAGNDDLTPEARNRIHVKYYDAGHMMYVHGPSMQKFRDDLVGFIRETDRL